MKKIKKKNYKTKTKNNINKYSLSDLQIELEKAQRKNEKAKHRIIGLTLETRPDAITPETIYHMRKQGCTRIELGLQAPDDKILKLTTDKFYLIRLSRLFGLAGESAMTKKSFVDIMLDLVINKNKKELDLVDDEKSCPTYAPDLAKFTKKLIEEKKPFGIYHGANSGVCTWYEFAKEIFKIKNLAVKCNPVPADKFPRPAKRPNFSELINTKVNKQRNWQEALREYLENN